MGKIISNKVKCNKCNTVIESKHVHDFKWCPCRSIAVDGGREYLKRAWTEDADYEELSEEVEDEPED